MSKTGQSPLDRTSRLLDLVPYLASHQGIELKVLAKDFDVSQAQMVSDLTTLWMCGLPGYTPLELMELSFESGFVTIRNAETLAHPRSLSEEEMIALLLGLDIVIASLPDDRENLKDEALDLVSRLSKRSSVPAQLKAIPSIPGSMRALIEDALRKKSAIEICYHSFYSDNISTRIVLPIELRQENGFEYLWAICQSAHALRSFKLDRIQSLVLSQITNSSPASMNSPEEIEISYTLRTHSRARQVMERFSLDKIDLEHDVRVSSFSKEWIRRSVLASAASVEVIEPASIRAEMCATAQSILNRYKGS